MLFVSEEDLEQVRKIAKRMSDEDLVSVMDDYPLADMAQELQLELGEIRKEVKRRGCERKVRWEAGRDSWKEVFRSDGT